MAAGAATLPPRILLAFSAQIQTLVDVVRRLIISRREMFPLASATVGANKRARVKVAHTTPFSWLGLAKGSALIRRLLVCFGFVAGVSEQHG